MSLVNMVHVEACKLTSTMSGKALLLVIVLLGSVGSIIGVVAPVEETTLKAADVYGFAAGPMILFIPIVIIATFTSEWTTRSSLLTFSLCPRRGWVLIGKIGFGATLAVVAPLVAALLVSAVTQVAALMRGKSASYVNMLGLHGGALQTIILVCLYSALAVGLATVIRHTAAAVTAFLALTLVSDGILGSILGSAATWFAPIRGFEKLGSGSISTLAEVGQATSVLLLWVVVPLFIGCRRFIRADVQ